jgi:hypothetical protein
MAMVRIPARCRTCEQDLLLRIGIAPAREMRIRCQCPNPNCGVALRMRLDVADPERTRFSSEDVAETPGGDPAAGALTLVLYTDLPVHRSLLGRPHDEPASAFIHMFGLWGERAAEYGARSRQLQVMRDAAFPDIRRAASVYAGDDLDRLPAALVRLGISDRVPELADLDAVYQLGRAIDLFHLPFVDLPARMLATQELVEAMVAAERDHPDAFGRLLELFLTELRFREQRRQIVETAMDALDQVDALLPGLAWEHVSVEPAPDPDEFRIVRDDFDQLRARYVDIFELASRTLAYVGAIFNLARRGYPTAWSSGSTAQVRTLLDRHASEREFILNELPAARVFYDAIRRHSRNAFGHYNVEYDFAAGELIDQRTGARTSFLLFLVDYLEAARMTAYLLTVAEKITLAARDPGGIADHVRAVEALALDVQAEAE